MELSQIETFRVVAQELSFSRAAAKLGYVQSSVSAQVSTLERELRVPLFDRLGRKLGGRNTGCGECERRRADLARARLVVCCTGA